jgi:branched-chain amino acid transport system permease protein
MFHGLSHRERLLMAVAVAGLLLLPLVVRDSYVLHLMILCMMFAIFASSWNLVTGFAGLKTFGHHAFFGIGAYASALISMNWGLSPWITIWLAGLIASGFGLMIALPVLRIRSIPHVAIVTLGFAEIVRITLSNLKDITRGEMGLWGIPYFDSLHLPFVGEVVFDAAHKVGPYYLIAGLFLACLAVITGLMRSKVGLALVAIRDAQDAAESLGINLTFYKMLAFAVSAFMVAVAGAFYAHYIVLLTPMAVVGLDLMILIIAMVLVGGTGTLLGPIIGTFVLTFGVESLRALGDYRMLIYGALIVGVVKFLPRGLASALDTYGPRIGITPRRAAPSGDEAAAGETQRG